MNSMRAALAAVAILCASTAVAQAVSTSAAIDVQLFKPGPGASDVLNVQGSAVSKPSDWHVGLFIHYSDSLLVIRNRAVPEDVTELVASQTTFDLLGSVGLFKTFELGLHAPLTVQSSEPMPLLGEKFASGVAGFGLGDVRIIPKYKLF